MTREKCPTCASYVDVVSGDDGTSYFVPIEENINKMKAEAIREFISHIKGMSDEDQKLKGRFQAELFWKGAFAVHEFGMGYAKQLEGGE